MTCIEQHVDSVSAVLVLADGRLGTPIDMDCTLSALSALIPKALVNNIALMFTRVWIPSLSDSLQSKVPPPLKSDTIFLLDNPITPGYSGSKRTMSHKRKALEMLVKLFDWLDSLEPQPATEIVCHYEQYQKIEAKTIYLLDQRAQEVYMRAEIDRLMIILKKDLAVSLSGCLHLSLESYARWMQDMDAFSGFKKTLDKPVLKQQSTTTRKIDGQVLVDEAMKKKWDEAKDGKENTTTLIAAYEMVDRKSTRLNSSHITPSRMPSSA